MSFLLIESLPQITYIYDSIVFFHGAQNIKPAQLPLSTFTRVDRGCANSTVDGGCIIVDEFESRLDTYPMLNAQYSTPRDETSYRHRV
jgi:hypothetical protein